MPIASYFKGRGETVMADMQHRYGAKKGMSVFYATAEKQGMKGHLNGLKAKGHFKKKHKKL